MIKMTKNCRYKCIYKYDMLYVMVLTPFSLVTDWYKLVDIQIRNHQHSDGTEIKYDININIARKGKHQYSRSRRNVLIIFSTNAQCLTMFPRPFGKFKVFHPYSFIVRGVML